MDDLKDLVKASLGPLPMVCQEQVLLDMERARMKAEDNQAAEKKKKRLEEQKEQALRRMRQARERCRTLEEEAHAVLYSVVGLESEIADVQRDIELS